MNSRVLTPVFFFQAQAQIMWVFRSDSTVGIGRKESDPVLLCIHKVDPTDVHFSL